MIVEGNDLYGDGVNIAAWVEALADAGGVFVSNPASGGPLVKLPFWPPRNRRFRYTFRSRFLTPFGNIKKNDAVSELRKGNRFIVVVFYFPI